MNIEDIIFGLGGKKGDSVQHKSYLCSQILIVSRVGNLFSLPRFDRSSQTHYLLVVVVHKTYLFSSLSLHCFCMAGYQWQCRKRKEGRVFIGKVKPFFGTNISSSPFFSNSSFFHPTSMPRVHSSVPYFTLH